MLLKSSKAPKAGTLYKIGTLAFGKITRPVARAVSSPEASGVDSPWTYLRDLGGVRKQTSPRFLMARDTPTPRAATRQDGLSQHAKYTNSNPPADASKPRSIRSQLGHPRLFRLGTQS